jgi:hypothetical protein
MAGGDGEKIARPFAVTMPDSLDEWRVGGSVCVEDDELGPFFVSHVEGSTVAVGRFDFHTPHADRKAARPMRRLARTEEAGTLASLTHLILQAQTRYRGELR